MALVPLWRLRFPGAMVLRTLPVVCRRVRLERLERENLRLDCSLTTYVAACQWVDSHWFTKACPGIIRKLTQGSGSTHLTARVHSWTACRYPPQQSTKMANAVAQFGP